VYLILFVVKGNRIYKD